MLCLIFLYREKNYISCKTYVQKNIKNKNKNKNKNRELTLKGIDITLS